VETETAIVHIHASPDVLDQLALVDDFAAPLGQQDQEIERAAADVKLRAVFLEEAGLRKQSKWPKRNGRVLVVV
jgi:hypothetical protein